VDKSSRLEITQRVQADRLLSGLPDDLNEDLRIQRLQDWLGFAEINDRECDIQEAHKATFRWALQLRQNPDDTTKDSRLNLAKWLRDSDGLFWIQGKLGSGKSTLMKYVWQSPLLDDYLRTWASGKPLYRAAFFFTKKGTSELQKSLQGLYRTLLAHLIRSNAGLIRIAFPHWRLRDAGHEPTIGVLRSALVRILEHATLSRKYCFFIDGLDEYEEANPKLQAELARDILNLADLSGVKIVAASRPEASFVGRFDGRPTLRLQDITQNDIENYVTAELGRTGSAVSRSLTHGQILRLADQVVLKAEGVFLWVVLVVADLIVGIDNVESYSELYDRLDSLDHDLYALFKQILLERIAPNHRQQIARHLLICSYSQKMNSSNQVAVHAIGHQVQAGLTGSQPDIYDAENTRQRILDLIMQLPVRSRGLCSVSDSRVEADVSVSLIHSSMSEFLADPDIRKILKDQAGDFETGLAVRIGLMARLVVAIDELRDDADGLERETLHLLLDIMHSLEIGRYVSGVIPLRSLTCLKELLEKPWQGYPFPTLDSLTWPWTLPAIGNKLPELKTRAGLLEYATSEGFTYYLQHHLDLNHSIPHTNDGCPLLFYAVSEESMAAQIFYDDTTSTTTQRTKPFELLLQQGADPNETYEGRTPWGELLRRFRNVWRDYDSSNRQWEIAPDILRGGLNAARHMLRHGADPSFGEVEIDSTTTGSADPDPDRDDVVSTRIFEDLLAVNCCRSTPLADCSCDVARLFRPQFVELAELVERKKVEKRLGLLVHLGWLGEHVARMFAVSYYAWAGLIALLAGLLLVLFV